MRELVDPPVGPTVDDLVSAFANMPGLAPTAAVDITVDGYVGKQIEFTVPDPNGCREDQFALWQEDGNQHVAGPPAWARATWAPTAPRSTAPATPSLGSSSSG